MADGEMKMTYSAIVRDKDNKRIVRVMFERKNGSLLETAEGLVPDGKIVKSSGFSPDEIKQLESYLWENSQSIMDEAKKISNPLKWL
ncbi:hypothetical protein [Butyrivibrio sp. AE2032]|uniref:hypothetical protein n=1 Tax=Butyrivibrio sp. AE2032 TaxID=1458463 RepID=UPI00068EA899|nr:hypothetical protein [Butyrivibrio sp. AE2032]